jgi:hypothetical protein
LRLKYIEINPITGKMGIDTTKYDKPVVILISDGKARETFLPDHGVTTLVTHQGKLKRVRFDEGGKSFEVTKKNT